MRRGIYNLVSHLLRERLSLSRAAGPLKKLCKLLAGKLVQKVFCEMRRSKVVLVGETLENGATKRLCWFCSALGRVALKEKNLSHDLLRGHRGVMELHINVENQQVAPAVGTDFGEFDMLCKAEQILSCYLVLLAAGAECKGSGHGRRAEAPNSELDEPVSQLKAQCFRLNRRGSGWEGGYGEAMPESLAGHGGRHKGQKREVSPSWRSWGLRHTGFRGEAGLRGGGGWAGWGGERVLQRGYSAVFSFDSAGGALTAGGEERVTAGEERVTSREEGVTAGEKRVTSREEGVTGGGEGVTAGEERVTAGGEHVTGREERVTAGEEHVTAGGEGVTGGEGVPDGPKGRAGERRKSLPGAGEFSKYRVA